MLAELHKAERALFMFEIILLLIAHGIVVSIPLWLCCKIFGDGEDHYDDFS